MSAPAAAMTPASQLQPGGHAVGASPAIVTSNLLRFRGHATASHVAQGVTDIRLQRKLVGDIHFGDWNGDGVATPLTFRDGRWSLHNQLDAGDTPTSFWFGRAGDIPLVGDWNGDGRDTVAVRREARFHLSDAHGRTAYDFVFGQASDTPLTGDFNGDGRDTVGVRRGATFYLSNRPRGGTADISATFGTASDVPLAGDWNGDGRDTVGVQRGARLFLTNDNRTTAEEFSFGRNGDQVRSWSGARPQSACPTAAFTRSSTHGSVSGQVRAPVLEEAGPGAPGLDQALQTANRYLLNAQWQAQWRDRPQIRGYYDVVGSRSGALEHAVRPPAMAAASLAISLHTGYDPVQTGQPEAFAASHVGALVRSISCQHKTTTMGGWGDGWQSSYWAQFTGLAAWLTWDDLRLDEQFYVARMVEYEADRLVNLPVRYWRDAAGNGPRNTSAEIMAWDASLVALAAAMMPNHPRRDDWQQTAVAYGIAAGSMPQDLQNSDLLHGRAVSSWIDGYNVMAEGLVYNHDRVSPDYSTAMHASWSGGLFFSLAEQATPRGLFHNGDRIYGALSTHQFVGGTVYVPDSDFIRYPEGSSWSAIQRAQFVNFDAMADVFGLDTLSPVSARHWQELHTVGQLELQSRFSDGRTYRDATEHRYPGREELTAHLLAYARLAEHVGELDRFAIDDLSLGTPPPAAPTPAPKEPSPSPSPAPEPTPTPSPTSTGLIPLAADVNGDGRSDLGWWQAGAWSLTTQDHFTYRFVYGQASDGPLLGDWNGDGRKTVGVKRGSTYYLSNRLTGGPADYSFSYGRAGDVTLVGDWNGDGRDTIGVRRGATFYLSNAPRGGPADVTFVYGRTTDLPLVGDWDGDGRTTAGIRRGVDYYLSNGLRGGPADYSFRYGRLDDVSIVGDYNGNGQDTVSVVRGTTFHINDHPRGGPATRTVDPPRPS
jgi:hypothetical protein